MNLDDYFKRIGWVAPIRRDSATLTAIMRAHSEHVPFENLDVQLRVPLTTSIEAAFEKIVERQRGGWCYEQNGLMGWVLSQIGFDVTRVAGSVMRADSGPASSANHLALLVDLPDDDRRWLVDVGFGGSLFAPLPLEEGDHIHAPFNLGLRRIEDGHWQFWENDGGGEFSFDFEDAVAIEQELSDRCDYLQTSPDSGFVQKLVCQARRERSHVTLRGRVLTTLSSEGKRERVIDSPDELVITLANEFGLDVPQVGDLWDRICARHREHFGDDA